MTDNRLQYADCACMEQHLRTLTTVEDLQAIIVECCGDAPTEEKAREYLRSITEKARREALEEAAKLCEARALEMRDQPELQYESLHLANAIRALHGAALK